jgi:Uma2 family endonuclease
MATTKLMTAEELWELQEPGRYALIRGELIQMAPAGGIHGEYGMNIGSLLWTHARQTGAGKVYNADTGYLLARDPDELVSPDVAFVRADRLPPEQERERFMPLAPDLAVEIVSPSDRSSDVDAKVIEYLGAGTQLVLVVQPRSRTVTAYTPDRNARVYTEADTISMRDVVPDFELAVADIFQ